MDLPELLDALSVPAAYPYPVESVEVRQTHISVAFLAGPYVYKIKKPVNPGFLDFTTLDRRRHFCEQEVRLNRRLAPHVYLGVVPVTRVGSGLRFEGDGPAVEWAVKMQRLPDAATLHARLGRGEVDAALVHALARRIAAFHCEAPADERVAALAQFENVARLILDILAQALPQVETTVHGGVFGRIQALTNEALARFRPLIAQRAARGVPRDCHGDLHLDHVYYFPDQPPPADLVIIDCIEFNDRLRCIDPVADMAFVAMDLAFHGRWDLAHAFADAYFAAAADPDGRALLPLYTAYRATVRGMVEGLELAEKEVPEAERAAALSRARAHWLLALSELEVPGRKPCLLLVAGLPGTGKSHLSRELADHAGFTTIRSDVVRKELAGLLPEYRTPADIQQSLYTCEWTDRTYDACLQRAGQLLFEGRRVLVDATFRAALKRQMFLHAADRWGVPSAILLCQADPETVRRRLEARRGDASDADWSIYLQLAASWEPMGPLAAQQLHIISTQSSPEHAFSQALAALRVAGLYE